MIRYLIKNNFKLMFRDKWVLALMLVGPILVIAVLSSAFANMMESYEEADEFRAGYRISSESSYAAYMDEIKDAGEKAGIQLENFPEGEPQEIMEQNDLKGFIDIGKDGYTLYRSDDYEIQGGILEYFMGQVDRQSFGEAVRAMIPGENDEITLPVQETEYMPAVDSKDYYGIIEAIYFAWLGVLCTAGILTAEKKNGIEERFRVSGIAETKLYLARWVPAVLIVIVTTAVTVGLSILLFGVSWGTNPMSIVVILACIMAAISVGMLLYAIVNNFAVLIIVLFSFVWGMGFIGGSFETYLFSNIPEKIKEISPIYYVNRTLVEYSCMGKSDYTGRCLLYMAVITVVGSVLAIGINKLRRRSKS